MLALCATGSAARTEVDPTFPCGTLHGPTWSVPGRTGSNWYVIAIQTRNECATEQSWVDALSAKLVSRGGADVQVFRAGPNATYGCIMIRSQLFASCRAGNGGHGTDGVIVLGNPERNPYSAAYRDGFNPSAQQQVADLAGVPGPKGTSICKGFTGPRWAFKAADGHRVSGTSWTAYGDSFTDGCRSVAEPRNWAAAAASEEAMRSSGFLVREHGVGDWGCVAAHDYAWPGGAGSISGVPVAGCARVIYPFGLGTLSAQLEQVIVFPDMSGAGPTALTGVTRAVQQQYIDTVAAASHHGITVVGVKAAAAKVVGGSHPETNAHTPAGVVQCGARRVGGGSWRHGSARGDSWLVAVRGGYPCELARTVFAPFLAYLTLSPATAAANLSRYGWSCSANRTAQTAGCSFSPPDSYLADALGRPVPAGMRVAISAGWSGGRAALATAIGS